VTVTVEFALPVERTTVGLAPTVEVVPETGPGAVGVKGLLVAGASEPELAVSV
jgi:hypothetical protein